MNKRDIEKCSGNEMFWELSSNMQRYLAHFSTQAQKLKKSTRRKFLMFQGIEATKKTFYMFSRESFSYISRNRNPEKILYVLGTFASFLSNLG